MDNLIARVATAANMTPDVARKAVALIGDFIQREAPDEAVRDLFDKAPAFPRSSPPARRPAARAWAGASRA